MQIFKAVDEEQMISVEVIYIPNTPDVHGQYMSPDTLRKACDNFNLNLSKGVVKPNLFHLENTEAFTIEKTWINECECEIGDKKVPEGSWLGRLKHHDKELWDMKKSGEIGGVSIGAKGHIHPAKIKEESNGN